MLSISLLLVGVSMFDSVLSQGVIEFCNEEKQFINGSKIIKSIVSVPNINGIYGLLQLKLTLNHTFSEDLIIELTHVESQQTFEIINRDCTITLIWDPAIFDDSANNYYDNDCSGDYFKPNDPFSDLTGDPSGDWTLSIEDTFENSNDGWLKNWCLGLGLVGV